MERRRLLISGLLSLLPLLTGDVVVPVIVIPEVNTPAVSPAAVSTPAVPVQQVETPAVDTARVEIVSVDEPEVDVAEISLPEIKGATVTTPAVSTVAVSILDVATALVSVPKVSVVDVSTLRVVPMDGRIDTIIALRKAWEQLLTDKRTAKTDGGIANGSIHLNAWMKIYASYSDWSFTEKPLPEGIRMIAEARAPKDQDQLAMLKANLAFYKARGYNAVLVSLYMTEDDRSVDLLLDAVVKSGLDIYVAYSGPERLDHTLFQDPAVIRRGLERVAPYAKGMLLGWRRTSSHLFIQDRAFYSYVVDCCRSANPGIAVIGECYFGDSYLGHGKAVVNVPAGCSAAMIVGTGCYGFNAEGITQSLFGGVSQPKLALILGERPYYATRNAMGRSFSANLAIKEKLERRYIKAGCVGTVTLHGDGSDGVYGNASTDNLSAGYNNNEEMK